VTPSQIRGREQRPLHVLRQLLHHVPLHALADKEGDGIVLMVGGKVSNRISTPKFSKVVVAFLPNEMPRWPQTTATIKKIVEAYSAGDANKYERVGDWAERIGWERFFEKCELEFTHHLIDDFRDPGLLHLASDHAVQVLIFSI
jgi:sulfite reductase beta subunit